MLVGRPLQKPQPRTTEQDEVGLCPAKVPQSHGYFSWGVLMVICPPFSIPGPAVARPVTCWSIESRKSPAAGAMRWISRRPSSGRVCISPIARISMQSAGRSGTKPIGLPADDVCEEDEISSVACLDAATMSFFADCSSGVICMLLPYSTMAFWMQASPQRSAIFIMSFIVGSIFLWALAITACFLASDASWSASIGRGVDRACGGSALIWVTVFSVRCARHSEGSYLSAFLPMAKYS